MSILLSNLVGLFLLMAVGALLVRFRILPVTLSTQLSRLLMSVVAPALIVHSLIRPFSMDFLRDSAVIFAVGMAVYAVGIAVCLLLARVFQVPQGRRGTWAICAIFPNNGFMGFPIIQAILGEEALALAVIMGIPFNILVYTVGVRTVLSDRAAGEGGPSVSLKSILLAPVNVATVLGLAIFLLQIPVPTVIEAPLGYLGDMATPLSMLIIGMELTKSSVGQVIRNRWALTAAATKLVIVPLLTWALLLALPLSNPLIAPVVLLTMAMPAAAIVSAITGQYEVNVDLAVEVTFLSDLLCMVTLPLVAALLL
jgi:hypothetical protein